MLLFALLVAPRERAHDGFQVRWALLSLHQYPRKAKVPSQSPITIVEHNRSVSFRPSRLAVIQEHPLREEYVLGFSKLRRGQALLSTFCLLA